MRERYQAEVVHERRYLDCRRESDGSVRLEARLAPDVGKMLTNALETAQAQLDKRGEDAVPPGVSEETPPAQSVLPTRAPATVGGAGQLFC